MDPIDDINQPRRLWWALTRTNALVGHRRVLKNERPGGHLYVQLLTCVDMSERKVFIGVSTG